MSALISILLTALTPTAHAARPSFEAVLEGGHRPEAVYLHIAHARDLCRKTPAEATSRLSQKVLGAMGTILEADTCAMLGRRVVRSPRRQLARLSAQIERRDGQRQADVVEQHQDLEARMRAHYAHLMSSFTAQNTEADVRIEGGDDADHE